MATTLNRAARKQTAKMHAVTRVFIPNRGEIACRLTDACIKLGLTPIVGFSIADSASRAVRRSPESVCIGPADARTSYLNGDRVIAAALEARADAIHPGYGFLSENADFVRKAARSGLRFIGPSALAMKTLGDKVQAKELARKCHIPLLEDISFDQNELRPSPELNRRISRYLKGASLPLLIKAAGGGGGRGMRVVNTREELEDQMHAASREAKNLFNDATIFIEPYIIGARHVEVQIIADSSGDIRALGTRDCSLQRRHQKVLEEAPASQLSVALQKKLCLAAEKICRAASYESLGTVEFLVTAKGQFYFLEVNTRLQVEHPVTELSSGLDLVELQIRIARGEKLSSLIPRRPSKLTYSMEARICAEAPELDFRSSTGPLIDLLFPEGENIRTDTGFDVGDRVTHYYDSLIAKVIVSGKTREQALEKLDAALASVIVSPLRTNLGYLRALVADNSFKRNRHTLLTAGEVLTKFSDGHQHRITHALLVAAILKSRPATDTPWASEGSWSSAGETRSLVNLRLNATFFQVCISRKRNSWRAAVSEGGKCLLDAVDIEFFCDTAGSWALTYGGKSLSGTCRMAGPGMSIIEYQGDLFPAEYIAPRIMTRASSVSVGGHAEIRAHLPGKIVSLSAEVGMRVNEGSLMLVLESMKMEHTIAASVRGAISELLVTTGTSVAAGDLLAVIIAGE